MTVELAVRPVDELVEGDDTFSYPVFLVWAAALALLIPLVDVVGTPDQGRSGGWRLAVLVTVWAGLRLAALIGAGRARYFTFFFFLYTYVFLGVAPTLQIRSARPASTTPDVLPSLDEVTLGLVLLGLVCFEVGNWFGGVRSIDPGAAPRRAWGISPARTTVLWVIGFVSGLYFVGSLGLATLLSSRDAAGAARAAIWPSPVVRVAVFALATYPAVVAIGGLTSLRRAEQRSGVRLGQAVMIATSVALLAFVVSPLITARYPLGTVVFSVAVMLGAGRNRARVRVLLSAAVFGLFFLFPLADAFRRSRRDFARSGFFGEYEGNPDYDSIWQIANAYDYWASGKSAVFHQALGVLLFFVPRSLWPGKPIDTGVLLAQYHGYRFTNLSAPLWAEALVNGGIVALVIVFLVLGWALRRLDVRSAAAQALGGPWLIVGAVLSIYSLIIFRGSLLQATATVVVVFACIVFVSRPPGPDRPVPDRPLPGRAVLGQPAAEPDRDPTAV